MRKTLFVLSLLVVVAFPALGASSYLGGLSGGILTPDGITVPEKTWEVSFHQLNKFVLDKDLTTAGLSYGVSPNLEIGASYVNGNGNDVAFNGKYRILNETAGRPSILVGVFDVGGMADQINSDPGLFIVFSKNITSVASEVVSKPSKPLRLSVGLGAGVYRGLFAGLDWTLEPKLSLMAEVTSGKFRGDDTVFNAGIRYAIGDTVRLDLGTVGFDNIAFGADLRFGY